MTYTITDEEIKAILADGKGAAEAANTAGHPDEVWITVEASLIEGMVSRIRKAEAALFWNTNMEEAQYNMCDDGESFEDFTIEVSAQWVFQMHDHIKNAFNGREKMPLKLRSFNRLQMLFWKQPQSINHRELKL